MSPIEKYISQEQIDESLKEWQHRLSLNDWTIKAKIAKKEEFINDGENHGECEYQQVGNCAIIRLRNYDELASGEWMQKQPQELVLVHELLHCKFMMFTKDTYESRLVEEYQHKLLEEIAKALIMTKYGLTLDWYRVD